MNKKSLALALLAGTVLSAGAQAQTFPQPSDVIVMRRIISPKDDTYISPASFQKVPTEAQVRPTTFPLPGGVVTVDTTVDVECRNGKGDIAPASNCANAPTPPSVGQLSIPAKANQALRTVSLSRSDLRSKAPSLENVDALCNSRIMVDGQTWRLTCNDEEIAGDYILVPTYATAVDAADLTDSRLSFNTDNSSAICIDLATGERTTGCGAQSKRGQGLGLISASVRAEPQLRVIVFDPADLLAQAPTLTEASMATTCASTVRVGGQAWRVSCNPEDLRLHYARKATKAYLQTPVLATSSVGKAPYQGTLSFSTNAAGMICLDTDTGEPAKNQALCDYLPPDPRIGTITVPATYSTSYRTVVFDRAAVLAQSPDVTNMDEQCLQATSMSVQTGGAEYWSVRCDPSLISGRYTKVAKVAIPSSYYGYERSGRTKYTNGTAGYPAFQDTLDFNTSTSLVCRDTQTNTDVAISLCNNLPNPAGVGTISAPVTFAPDFRLALLDPARITALAPEVDTVALCKAGFTFYLQGFYGGENWKLTCDPAEIVNHYKRVSTQGTLASKYNQTGSSSGFPYAPGVVYTDTVEFSTTAGGVLCVDTRTNQPVTADKVGKCDYLPNQEGYGTYTIPAKYSIDQRKVYFSRADILSRSPSLTNVDAMCNQAITVRLYSSGSMTQTWQTTCNAEDVRSHYKVVATTATWTDANRESDLTTTPGAVVDLPITLLASQAGKKCIDTDTNTEIVGGMSGACQYMDVDGGARLNITGRFTPDYKTVYVKRSDIEAKMPHVDTGALCASTVSVPLRANGWGTRETWKVTCNAEDVRVHHRSEPKSLSVANTLANVQGPSNGKPAFNSPLFLNTATSVCIDTDTNSPASDPSRCQHLTTPAPFYDRTLGYHRAEIAGQWSPLYRLVYINPDDVRAQTPYGTTPDSAVCGVSFNIYTAGYSYNESWRTTCNQADIREHYANRPATVNDYYIQGTSFNAIIRDDCYDTDTNVIAPSAKCQYAPGSGLAGQVVFTATVDHAARTYIMDVRAKEAQLPNLNWNTFCSPQRMYDNSYYNYTRSCLRN